MTLIPGHLNSVPTSPITRVNDHITSHLRHSLYEIKIHKRLFLIVTPQNLQSAVARPHGTSITTIPLYYLCFLRFSKQIVGFNNNKNLTTNFSIQTKQKSACFRQKINKVPSPPPKPQLNRARFDHLFIRSSYNAVAFVAEMCRKKIKILYLKFNSQTRP